MEDDSFDPLSWTFWISPSNVTGQSYRAIVWLLNIIELKHWRKTINFKPFWSRTISYLRLQLAMNTFSHWATERNPKKSSWHSSLSTHPSLSRGSSTRNYWSDSAFLVRFPLENWFQSGCVLELSRGNVKTFLTCSAKTPALRFSTTGTALLL